MPKSALGKGLDSLLSPDITDLYSNDAAAQSSDVQSGSGLSVMPQQNVMRGEAAQQAGTQNRADTVGSAPVELDPTLLKPNPFQPRRTFNEESLQELAASIKEHGIIQPIIA